MGLKLTNNATTTLVSGISPSATVITLTDASRFPVAGSGNWFPITVVKATGEFEIMRCDLRSGNVLTVDRAEEGTTALTFAGGDRVDVRMTAGALTAALSELETSVNADMAALETSVDADLAAKPTGNTITRLYTGPTGSWSKPTPAGKLKSLSVLVVAGGGGGAGVPTTIANQHYAGGGGGAGGSTFKEFTAAEILSLPASLTVLAGVGGAGGTTGNGAAGGDSKFGTSVASGQVVAESGQGGARSALATTTGGPLQGAGGAGGGSSGGSVNYWGQRAGNGVANIERNTYSRGGDGGSSPYGSAPIGNISQHVAGENALGYAAGGSGACNSHLQTVARAGGKGAPGFVLVTERY